MESRKCVLTIGPHHRLITITDGRLDVVFSRFGGFSFTKAMAKRS